MLSEEENFSLQSTCSLQAEIQSVFKQVQAAYDCRYYQNMKHKYSRKAENLSKHSVPSTCILK